MKHKHRSFGSLRHGMYASMGAGLILYETSLDLLRDTLDAARIAPEEGRRVVGAFADRAECGHFGYRRETETERGGEYRGHGMRHGESRGHGGGCCIHDAEDEVETSTSTDDLRDIKEQLQKINDHLFGEKKSSMPKSE